MYIQPDMINPSSARGLNRLGHPKSINPNIEPWLHPYLKGKKMKRIMFLKSIICWHFSFKFENRKRVKT